MAAWVNLWPAYSSLILHSSRGDHAHLSLGFLIPYICLLAFNLALERCGLGFSSSELLTICCIGMVATQMHGEWLSNYLLEMLTVPYYFASPENRWEDLVLPHIPDWAVVADQRAATHFYEGLPPGEAFPWAFWVTPLFWWGTFLGAILAICLCLSVILRKQWMDHERLAFPVAAALLELTGVSGTRGTLAVLVRTRRFQLGFCLTFLIVCWYIATWFFVSMPLPPILSGVHSTKPITIARGFPVFHFRFSPFTFVFGYFTSLEILFSIWFFHVLATLQAGIFNRLGLDMGSSDPWCSFHPAVGWQSFGGMTVFVLWGLWIGRAHLRDVIRKAFQNDDSVDDSDELMSYRTAVWMLLFCTAFVLFWLHQAGLDWGAVLTFWFATLVLYLGLARIMVESGLVYLRGPITAQAFSWHTLGIAGLGPAGAVALALTNAFICDAKTFAMTAMAHVPRLGMAMNRPSRKTLAPAVLLGCFIGAVTVVGFILYYGYHVMGSYNFGTESFVGIGSLNAAGNIRLAAGRIQDGTFGTDWNRIFYLAIGAAFSGILLYVRYLFPRFNIHPIGFTISASAPLRSSTFTIFLVWAFKSLVLRLRGLEQYRRITPFLLGMLMGYLTGIALGVFVDFFWFPGNGHEINVNW